MTVDAETLKRLIAAELAAVPDARLSDHLRQFIVEPHVVEYGWDYGPDDYYPCWLVLEHPPSGTGIGFCEYGFGPKHPWGLLWLPGSRRGLSMGQDSGWFKTFIDAALDCSVVTELEFTPPPPAP